MNYETRSLREVPELRADAAKRTLTGYAAVFNSGADIGGSFREVIAPGAFTETLANSDVRALVDHDSGRLIGRKSNGTLRLEQDARGLRVEIDLPDTTDGRDLAELVGRGDLDGMSFGFIVRHDEWDETSTPPTRTIHAVELREVSAVTFPAYDDTSLALRSLNEARSKVKQHNFNAAARRLQMKTTIALAKAR
jgi:uncharacterized protein